ncbi:hypothetical protein [Candidatus Reidiella endopervernicosa]|uniref:Uncharacterized protein n=1 Tax=Candidatus Reidiella endopervernicosa TaxID=2738883 RepID=A0A6N0HVH1_9GAMM|nr:hypothetical protein [Candidatus Reidiella endopervernicosa]QKQ26412.1 hypothetical protein HUE57_09050 [Candidatus Reidiella endopervernicosa]
MSANVLLKKETEYTTAPLPGVAIFAKVCFGHPSQANSKNFTRPFMPAAPRPSCVRCVITSSRLYTTPQ